jgi:hypothetical protein
LFDCSRTLPSTISRRATDGPFTTLEMEMEMEMFEEEEDREEAQMRRRRPRPQIRLQIEATTKEEEEDVSEDKEDRDDAEMSVSRRHDKRTADGLADLDKAGSPKRRKPQTRLDDDMLNLHDDDESDDEIDDESDDEGDDEGDTAPRSNTHNPEILLVHTRA